MARVDATNKVNIRFCSVQVSTDILSDGLVNQESARD